MSATPFRINEAPAIVIADAYRRYMPLLKARLRRLFERWGAPYVDGRFPPA
jgi:hypothetical protein